MDMSSQGKLDDKTLRYISENAEVENVLLTPFRWLIGAGKVIIYTLLLMLWFTFTLFGWVFNVGEYSLENRREAVCDARAYFHFCDPYEFNQTHPHDDYVWNLSRIIQDGTVIDAPDAHPVGDPNTVAYALASGGDADEMNPTAKPWIDFHNPSGFFFRSNDVFRRKSAQMDAALADGADAQEALITAISHMKHINPQQVRLRFAPDLVIRQGVIPADGMGSKTYVTWGICLKQECAADGSDLNYALFWGDVMWTKPALGVHQQDAVDALERMGTLPFWLREFHANGVQDDELIQGEFRQYQHDRTITGQDFEREVLHEE